MGGIAVRSVTSLLLGVLLLALARAGENEPVDPPPAEGEPEKKEPTLFRWPCEKYLEGLKGRGNFGVRVSPRADPAFAGSHHLGEDVWLPAGTPVRSIAEGVVMYSDFSPTWTDARGVKHWNLGNVIVIEHALVGEKGDPEAVCSVYVHLSKNRRVKTGDRVERGRVIGEIGADRSEENGHYPAHLHFAMHKGPYYQISPSWRREVAAEARKRGLPVFEPVAVKGSKPGEKPKTPAFEMVKGEVAEMTLVGKTFVEVKFKGKEAVARLSLLVASTSPGYRPASIVAWCQGYGDRKRVKDWIKPSRWIRARLA